MRYSGDAVAAVVVSWFFDLSCCHSVCVFKVSAKSFNFAENVEILFLFVS